ncbi:MAG: heme A synthase [Flavobacteriales bacterium]|nr:heme A synthase [Flavobacteriales bacterium]|tara:strand:+ start:29453 stop:30493 length:1041 start_codon:yes stop_codon:yes gene_type:complete
MNKEHKPIVVWLLTGCVLIFIMVAIGGMTRLTHSGLSMVEWTLFGSAPPSDEAHWNELFDKYKQYPEYQQVNFNFSVEEFKRIFWWEYIHRQFGRMIGLVFIVPFLWFWLKGKLNSSLKPKLILILIMGGFQGLLGWYMVKSGLKQMPDVSHYRLAMHLITAFLTFAYTFWVALGLIYPNPPVLQKGMKKPMVFLLLILIFQIVWGAYVAGLNAGKVYTTWPLMGDTLIPEAVTAMQPWWSNFIEGIAGVQFVHRYLAYVVLALIIYLFVKSRKLKLSNSQQKGIYFLLFAVSLQFVLGVFTLLFAVPVSLGLLHQLGAFVLLGATVYALHRFHEGKVTYAQTLAT